MTGLWIIICLHQITFQAMFMTKNIMLRKKLGRPIRGNSLQVNLSILFFMGYIGLALCFSLYAAPAGTIGAQGALITVIPAFILLGTNLVISAAALIHLKDSWRVGIIKQQKNDLVTTGIYGYSRNPYFVSYIIMFLGYAVLLQNLILLGLTIAGWIAVHGMIIKEEQYLSRVHGKAYQEYRDRVPRYLFF